MASARSDRPSPESAPAEEPQIPQFERIEQQLRSAKARALKAPSTASFLWQSDFEDASSRQHTVVLAESPTGRETYFLCHENERLIATALLATSCENPQIGTLGLVAVHPRLRRSGIATALCERARDVFASQGGLALFLGLGNGNPPAFRLYNRLGWRKLAGANIMAYLANGESPEAFLLDYFASDGPHSISRGNVGTDGIPMLPLLYTPHDWQVLDANAGVLSIRYATQTSCMALFWQYESVRRGDRGDWFVARDERHRIVGLSSVRLASEGAASIDAFTHADHARSLRDLVTRTIEWAAQRDAATVEVQASVEDGARQGYFRDLGFRERGAGRATFSLDRRSVPSLRLERRLRSHSAQLFPPPRSESSAPRAAGNVKPILDSTFEHLRNHYGELLIDRRIRTLWLDNFFSVVELDDGSVGASMSYFRFPLPVLEIVQSRLDSALSGDPLLSGLLFAEAREPFRGSEALVIASLKATVVGALSDRILRSGGDESFSVHLTRPYDPFAGARRALVLGFGGYLDRLVHLDGVRDVHVADLGYGRRRTEMDSRIEHYRRAQPDKRITVSDGHDTKARWSEADVVSITGSTLCNGSLDALLDECGTRPRIVLQGASACLHPKVLFDRGVDFVATMLKPAELPGLAARDVDRQGRWTRPVLEHQLPWVYFTPASAGGGDRGR